MRRLSAFEWIVAVSLAGLAVFLHVDLFLHAGGLWRDEIGAVHVAQAPFRVFTEQYESFPGLGPFLFRGWLSIAGPSITSLRLLGLLSGLFLLASMFVAVRALGVRVPLIATGLAGCAGTIIRYGDSVRPYGFAAALGLLSMAALYRTVNGRSRSALIVAMLLSLLSVHATYYNSLLLFACCVGAAVCQAVARKIKEAVTTLCIGVLCGLSLLVYLPGWRAAAAWTDLTRYEGDVLWIFARLIGALGGAERGWLAAVAVAVGLAIAALSSNPELRVSGERRDAIRFSIVTLTLFVSGELLFLRVLRYLMQPWYFHLMLVVSAVLIDVLIAIPFERRQTLQLLRGAAAVMLVAASFGATRMLIEQRATNMDAIADIVSANAAPGDFVVVYPWQLGITFANQYEGQIAWETLPPVADHSVHRYDEAKRAVNDSHAEDKVIRMSIETLQRGHRVWYAGFPLFLESSAYRHKSVHPAGIVDGDLRWSAKFSDAIRATALRTVMIVVPDDRTVEHERAALMYFTRSNP